MRRAIAILSFLWVVALPSFSQIPPEIRKSFTSKDYSVAWGRRPHYPTTAQLEIGLGNGHGGTLKWIRFVPGGSSVRVLMISLAKEHLGYSGPLLAVKVSEGQLASRKYRLLLNKLAIIASARLKPIPRMSVTSSSSDFWSSVRLRDSGTKVLDLDFAGYSSSLDEIKYVKPETSVELSEKALASVKFNDNQLTAEDG